MEDMCRGDNTMTVKVVWIDDDESRKDDAKTLESRRNDLKIEFVGTSDFEDFFRKYQFDIDLFLIDDKLRGRSVGVGIAGKIREISPEVPIYLFTAYPRDYGISTSLAEAATSLGDDILDIREVQREGHDILYNDAVDYRLIRESSHEDIDAIFNLLKAPEEDYKGIILALPENLKRGLLTHLNGNSIAFAKWVKRVFLLHPGFVYNSLFSATKLGMTTTAFQKHISEFLNARYDGVFFKTRPEMWWDSKLDKIVFKLTREQLPDDDTSDLRRLTPKLFSLSDSEVSKCVICGERYPDTVGINKDDERDFQPIHYKCSEPHPTKTRILYFEEARQFSMGE
ncbi:MAG: hypothetical protein ACFFBD_08810 [Candidatus Hodarchaeota archaeon]